MTQDELRQLIARAAREGWTELDLRDHQITELPPEIGQLTNLQKLAVGRKSDIWIQPEYRNPLKALPPEIAQLTQLRELDLRRNQLTAVPPEIGQLTRLTELNLSFNQLTAVPPEIGQLTRLTELNLSFNQLTAVPSEIGRLINLTELYLSYNELTAVPPEIEQLTSLTELDLSGNQLTGVPLEISHLVSLKSLRLRNNQLNMLPMENYQMVGLLSLDLSWNQLTKIPPRIGQQSNLQSLDLYHNKLTMIPAEIGQLTRLISLDLSSNKLTAVPPEIGQLTRLTSLDLGGNQLTAVPLEIGQLTRLTSLDLGGNQLTAVPLEIGQLTRLTSLDLGGNQLTAVPLEIGQLTRLTSLDFSSNKLTAVPPEIVQLTHLTELNLSHNKLTAVPPEIVQLTRLTEIDLSWNQLTTVPPEIGQLASLAELDLRNNRLIAVPPEIGQLTSLTSFALSFNQLTAVPPEIGQLTSLTSFALSFNQLTAVPPEIGQLTSLTSLALSGNQLTAMPPEIVQLTSLIELDLSGNQLAVLPPALRRLTKLEKLHLYDNPLPLPPELLGDNSGPGNPQAILDAYFQASRPLREAKLLLVGEGDVGKTATINRLLHNRFSEARSKTIGVDIHRWEVGTGNGEREAKNEERGAEEGKPFSVQGSSLRVNIWDFGGQEIYHSTHQFFLTHRSLYLLVLDATKDEAANRLDYWLRHIQSFAGDAPIILVVNKTDQHHLALDERSLLLKYPAIRSPIQYISCKSGAGIPELRQAIEGALAALPHVNDWIPVTWFAVKEKLAALGKDFLPYESYVDLCEAEGITHEAAQRTLARFLHDLGAALHFHDDRRLAGTNVLNPEWVTGGIYAILNEPTLQERGILRLSDLDGILSRRRYPAFKHPFLLDIMGKFELAAPLADRQSYLIPGLLPKTRPDFPWPVGAPVALEYRYAILPAAVLSRLMVRLHHHTWQPNDQPVRWRNGLGITRDGCRALIIADPDATRLTIALDGPSPHRRHLLAVIRAELDEIHGSFARLESKEWVPLPGKPGAATPYHALLNLEARGITTYYDPIHDVEIDVRALLDGLESPIERDERRLANVLREKFNKAELRQLAHDLGVDHEDLPGETKTDLARELALICQRQGRLAELAERVGRERP